MNSLDALDLNIEGRTLQFLYNLRLDNNHDYYRSLQEIEDYIQSFYVGDLKEYEFQVEGKAMNHYHNTFAAIILAFIDEGIIKKSMRDGNEKYIITGKGILRYYTIVRLIRAGTSSLF